MASVAKTKQGISLQNKSVGISGIHAENSNGKYWFRLEEGDADMVSDEHLKLLCVQEPGETSSGYLPRLSISGTGLMSLPDSIARQALKTVLTERYDREFDLLFIRDLKNTSTIADFFRIFVRDFGPSSAAVCRNSYCASVDVTCLEFRFQEGPQVREALVAYLIDKNCWHFYQGIQHVWVHYYEKPVPTESVARLGSAIAQAMCGSTMRYLFFSSCRTETKSPGPVLSFLRNLILGTSETEVKIHNLFIHHSYVSDDDGSQILALLSSSAVFENLKYLDFYGDATAEKTSEALGEFLSKPRCPIQRLYLLCNYHESDLQRKDLRHVSHIFHGLSRNTSLKHVRLEFPDDEDVVRDDIAIQVALVLRLNRKLESLTLRRFVMSEKGATILADTLVESCLPLASLGVYRRSDAMIQHIEVWERCLQCNPYLGQLETPPVCGPVDGVDRRLLSVMYMLCLNRAGRRFFFLPTSTRSSKRRKTSKHPTPRLPLALWPLLLARVSKKDFVDPYSRALGICPADMIYRMLQDGPIIYEW